MAGLYDAQNAMFLRERTKTEQNGTVATVYPTLLLDIGGLYVPIAVISFRFLLQTKEQFGVKNAKKSIDLSTKKRGISRIDSVSDFFILG